jgi:hypothetical protein
MRCRKKVKSDETMNSRQATAELTTIKGFFASLRRAEKQVAQGKTVSFAKVRRKA